MPKADEYSITPPSPERVAARALVLSVISCRGLIEQDAGEPEAERLRESLLGWLDSIGALAELESSETELISTPLGGLDRKRARQAGWQSEGMVVLAWALGFAKLPAFEVECDPTDIANRMGFLDERHQTPLHSPRLRDMSEIETWADTYLTLHWRLREFSVKQSSMDFVTYVSECQWARLSLDHLETQNRDLAIDGVRVDKLECEKFRKTLGITQERHIAFNWLLGLEPIYSQVTADT
jgi:hypothetical protein